MNNHQKNRTERYRPVPAVKRVFAILRLLGQSDQAMSVSAVARELDLIPSTALHTLRELIREELVTFNPDMKRYEIDAGVLTIASGVLRRGRFAYRIQPELNRISRQFDLQAFALRVTQAFSTVVAVADVDRSLRIDVGLGTKRPAILGVTGRLFAAFGNERKSDLIKRMPKADWYRTPSPRDWWRDVEAARKNGYAVDIGNTQASLTGIGAPVFDYKGRLVHTVTAWGMTEHCEHLGVGRIAEVLKAAVYHVTDHSTELPASARAGRGAS